ncbi:TetR/AcrR family transcriptional regulator [Streptomyces sp. NPDC001220]
MPRITPERRAANRAVIVAAARRCFSRDGFHRTSMPGIAAEAGVAVGAAYRYFTGKDDLIIEVAKDAFAVVFGPLERLHDQGGEGSAADLIATAVRAAVTAEPVDAAGNPVPVGELLRCAVQTWGEILHHEGLHERAADGVERALGHLTAVLRRGQRHGDVPADLDPVQGARAVMALLHGYLLQQVAFGPVDADAFTHAVRALLAGRPVA